MIICTMRSLLYQVYTMYYTYCVCTSPESGGNEKYIYLNKIVICQLYFRKCSRDLGSGV